MKCEECSELLIDYMHNELGSELRDTVKDHMSTCSKCSKEFEEYAEIKMAAQAQQLPEISSEVLAKLSKAASNDIKKTRTPFWKKWSYSPILVPTLTTAIALSAWFYFGDEALNLGPELASNKQEMILKPQVEAGQIQSQDTQTVKSKSANQEQVLEFEEQIQRADQNDISDSEQESETFASEQSPTSPREPKISSNSEFKQETKELADEYLHESQDRELQVHRKVKASPEQPISIADQKHEGLGLEKSNIQREQYEMSSQKIIDDDCEVSIRTNEAIINSSNPISKPVKKRSFKTLAQCYEQKGDYDKAISNYINLEQVAPEEASFANSRIQDIRNRIKLEQNQQKQLSAPQPTN